MVSPCLSKSGEAVGLILLFFVCDVLPVQKFQTPACHLSGAISIRIKFDRRWHREWRYSPGLTRGLLPIRRRLAPAAGASPTGPQRDAPWDPRGKGKAASDPLSAKLREKFIEIWQKNDKTHQKSAKKSKTMKIHYFCEARISNDDPSANEKRVEKDTKVRRKTAKHRNDKSISTKTLEKD